MHVPKGCSLFQRNNNGWWEARMMVNGVQRFITCCKNKTDAHKKLIEVYKNKKKKPVKEKEYTLFTWLDHWHKVYRLPKLATGELSDNTLKSDIAFIRKIKKIFKDIKLRDLTADYIQAVLYSMTQGRTCEGVYTVLKMALTKARDRTRVNVMDLVEKVKHERVRGRALTSIEIEKILTATENRLQKDIIHFYLYTGCRVSELTTILVKHINLDLNEIFIDGTKTQLSKRSLPIMSPLRPILERLIANRNGEENLFNNTFPMIRYFYYKIHGRVDFAFTLKDFRHTCATNLKDAGIPSSIYFRWFGWTDETMAKQVYTHTTDYEMKISQEWAKKFDK